MQGGSRYQVSTPRGSMRGGVTGEQSGTPADMAGGAVIQTVRPKWKVGVTRENSTNH